MSYNFYLNIDVDSVHGFQIIETELHFLMLSQIKDLFNMNDKLFPN